MKVRIKRQPTGYISLAGGPLQAWPAKGAVVELPDTIAQDLIDADAAEKATVAKATEEIETRPAPKLDEEVRPGLQKSVAQKGVRRG